MLIEVRQRRKVVGLAVLHHEERARLNHLRCQNLARNLAEVRQVVRRVNKNHVVLLRGGVDKLFFRAILPHSIDDSHPNPAVCQPKDEEARVRVGCGSVCRVYRSRAFRSSV